MKKIRIRLPDELYQRVAEDAKRRGMRVATYVRYLIMRYYGVAPDPAKRPPPKRQRPRAAKWAEVAEELRRRPWLAVARKAVVELLGVGDTVAEVAMKRTYGDVLGVHPAVYEALKRDLAAWLCAKSREWKSAQMSISIADICAAAKLDRGATLPFNRLLGLALRELGGVKHAGKYLFENGTTCKLTHCYGDLRVLKMLYRVYLKPSEDGAKALWEAARGCVGGYD